ncbi:MAG: DUF1178 family protein [Desulfatiglandales bacterium]
MIVFEIVCSNGHVFEEWFQNSVDYGEKLEKGLIKCPHCGDTNVRKILSPVPLAKNTRPDDLPDPPQKVAMHLMAKALYDFVEKNFEDVGPEFAKEALKIHYGISEPKNIKGTATKEEEAILEEEGVNFIRLPKPDPLPKLSMN